MRLTERVPYYFADREYVSCRVSILDAVERVFQSGQVLQGDAINDLERSLEVLTGRTHCVLVGSCTDALFFALRAAGIKAGDEVLVPDFSFIASASAIIRSEGTPVFCDVGPDYNLDLRQAAASVTSKTKAIVLVQLFGHMADPEEVEAFARDRHLVLIEDAAQALGGTKAGRPAGSVGDTSCFSFDPTKPLGCPGSGGAVLTDDGETADQVRQLRYHGLTAEGDAHALGFNSQIPTASAEILSIKLAYLPSWTDHRRSVANAYRTGLEECESVVLPPFDEIGDTYSKFVIRLPGRDRVRRRLDSVGIETRVHYAKPLHEYTMFSGYADSRKNRHSAEYSEQVLSLPIHPFLSAEEVDRVVAGIKDALTA